MSRRPPSRPLSPEERDLWRRVAKGVNPLDSARLKRLEDPAPPRIDASRAPAPAPLKSGAAFATPPRPAGAKSPADRSGDRKIRRGRVEVEARIDLHGLTTKKARRDLLRFLERAQGNGVRQVLVITGKGAGARAQDRRKFEPWDPEAPPLPGVLRRSFSQWMADPEFAQLVSGYAEAHRRHGGSGAFYVMVRA